MDGSAPSRLAARGDDRNGAEPAFDALERALAGFGRALWGAPMQLRGFTPARPDQPSRAGFEGIVLRLPDLFRGYGPAETRRLYLAAVAHVAAHLRFGGAKFPVGQLKPLQIALVSLIEDARVERLAMAELPGLERLWRPFHAARPTPIPTAEMMLARLARALADSSYEDPDAWVARGRRLFEAARLDDPAMSRAIGGLLGNDLGQMRLPFNAKLYAVEPAYRDDNAGLWDFGDGQASDAAEDALPVPVRTAQPEGDDRPPRERDSSLHASAEGEPQPVQARAVEEDAGVPVARYPEWDYLISRERRDWTLVLEHEPPAGDAQPLRHLRRPGEGATAAPPGVEGDVQGHGYGGQGTVATEEHGGGHLPVFAPKIRARAVLIYVARWTPSLP